jgi:hypothetical protein
MKAYNNFKNTKDNLSLNDIDKDVMVYQSDEHNKMFIQRYYAFIQWFKIHLPNIYYTKKIKEHIWYILDFMDEGMDGVDDFLKLRVAEKFRERYPNSNTTMTRHARANLYQQYLYYIKFWDDGITNPKPMKPTGVSYINAPLLKDLNGGTRPRFKTDYIAHRKVRKEFS